VMFDALAHGLPFVASELEFFKEFADMKLGIVCKRDAKSFAKGMEELAKSYDKYFAAVESFKQRLKWDFVANEHVQLYESAISNFGLAHYNSLKSAETL